MTAQIIVMAEYRLRHGRVTARVAADPYAWFWAWFCFWTGMTPRERDAGVVRKIGGVR